MNKRGVFGVVIFVVLAVFLVWAWSLIAGDLAVITDSTISSTSGATHSAGIEFILRSWIWVVPLIVVVGLLWAGVSR